MPPLDPDNRNLSCVRGSLSFSNQTKARSMAKAVIKSLYYITHVDNIPSMIEKGIFSHSEMEAQSIPYTPIYDAQIVGHRQKKMTPAGETLWNYANLYFQPRNPMMYRVMLEKKKSEIGVIGIDPAVMNQDNNYITDGNAANGVTEFYSVPEGKKILERQWGCVTAEYWRESDGSKRKIMAECLIPRRIPPESIHSVFLCDTQVWQSLRAEVPSRISVVYEPHIFFRADFAQKIGQKISLVRGDMFFSQMQTLTVSVNLQGIMGKGLASRAKYQFPDVYVAYQDMCRFKRLTASQPCLYKREASLDEELADQTDGPIKTPNAAKWFLLFATKRRWQENSRLEDIEAGLEWFRRNFEKEKVKSIAFPALGCGLGGLPWSEVGPLMCRKLHDIGIDVAIYLPQETKTNPEHLTEDYLLQ